MNRLKKAYDEIEGPFNIINDIEEKEEEEK